MKLLRKINKTHFIVVAISIIVVGIISYFLFQPDNIKASSFRTQSTYNLLSSQNEADFESTVYSSDFEYNAIAPSWKEKNTDENSRQFYIRSSEDKNTWTEWQEVDVIKPQKDGVIDDRLYPEFPVFQTGKYFQYKLKLTRNISTKQSPEVSDVKIDYIDSRASLKQKIGQTISSFFKVSASGTAPNIVSRSDWGNPDPYNTLFKNDPTRYWPAENLPVNQVFLHHTVDSNYSSDYSAIVRAIWQYHSYTLNWGDIGYNYLVDPNGVIYEGRFGGDGVVAGHTLEYNRGSMGVALIGCYQPNNSLCYQFNNVITSPSTQMMNSLTDLLAYKMTDYEIDPTATHVFCDKNNQNCLNIGTIAGHRDAYATACPGDYVYNSLSDIRNEVATKKASLNLAYSAKQIDFSLVYLDNNITSSTVTLHFKNTGNSTWVNSGPGRLLLKTANPENHASAFQSDLWVDSTTAAILNESSVPPGSTGSFTVKFNRPVNYEISSFEYVKLVSENNYSFPNYFTIPISSKVFQSQSVSSTDSISIPQGGTRTGWIKIKNTGNEYWLDDITSLVGNNLVYLATSHTLGRSSNFGSTWNTDKNISNRIFTHVYESDGITLAADQHTVQPGQIAYWEIIFSAPADLTVGQYTEYFQPIVLNYYDMNDPNASITLNVAVPSANLPISYKSQGDLNGDLKVDLSDLSVCAINFNTTNTTGDVNNDGRVDISDLSIIASNWSKSF